MNPFFSAVSMASDVGRLTVLAGNLWLCRWQVQVQARTQRADTAAPLS